MLYYDENADIFSIFSSVFLGHLSLGSRFIHNYTTTGTFASCYAFSFLSLLVKLILLYQSQCVRDYINI